MGTYLIVALLFVAIAAVLVIVKRKDQQGNWYDGLNIAILAIALILTVITLVWNSGTYQWGSFLLILAVSIMIVRRIWTERRKDRPSSRS
ncbi:hypothetical protein [Paenibacillus campi]|uniref:hypothetical protein n=1 Tax=Paenibacillus campi TaxID=3106031 RepID=UPI002AFE505B|nr:MULTISPECIES: hypothetical protein [unclassified Paenibacillus]